MGVIIRKSLVSSVATYMGAVLGYVNLLLLFPYYLKIEEIGLYRTLMGAALVLLPFALLGTVAIIQKYYPKYRNNQADYAKFFTFTILTLFIGLLIYSGLYWLFEGAIMGFYEEEAPELQQHSLLLWLTVFGMAAYSVFENYSRVQLKVEVPAFLRDVVIKLVASAAIILYGQGIIPFSGVLASFGISHLLAFVLILLYIRPTHVIRFTGSTRGFILKFGKELWGLGLFSILSSGVLLFISQLDGLMVSGMLGLGQNGIYTTTTAMTIVIDMPRKALSQINMPILARSFEKKDHKHISFLYKATGLNQQIFGILFFLGIACNLPNVYALMPKGDQFSVGFWVFIVIGLGRIFDMSCSFNSSMLLFSPHFKWNVVAGVVLLVFTVVSNYLLIPEYGILGAAVATLFSLLIFNMIKGGVIYWKMGMHPYSRASLLNLGIGILTGLVGWFLPHLTSPLWDATVRSVVIAGLYVGLTYWSGLSPQFNSLVQIPFKMLQKWRGN